MKLSLLISKFSIKKQLYDGIEPSEKHILTKKLVNALFSKRWEPIIIGNEQYFKLYIDGTKYRAVVQEAEFQENLFVLIYFRSKNDLASENISNYQNYSSQVIQANHNKIADCIEKQQYTILNFEK